METNTIKNGLKLISHIREIGNTKKTTTNHDISVEKEDTNYESIRKGL